MELRIFTLPFDPILEGFPDEVVTAFCLNKRVYKLESQFFQQEGRAYWSVAVHYEVATKAEVGKVRDLEEGQQLLYDRLREWRKETAHKDGVPVYLIATNQQLLDMVRGKLQTVEGLKGVKGFGKGKIERYGRQLLTRIKAFYDEKPALAPDTGEVPF